MSAESSASAAWPTADEIRQGSAAVGGRDLYKVRVCARARSRRPRRLGCAPARASGRIPHRRRRGLPCSPALGTSPATVCASAHMVCHGVRAHMQPPPEQAVPCPVPDAVGVAPTRARMCVRAGSAPPSPPRRARAGGLQPRAAQAQLHHARARAHAPQAAFSLVRHNRKKELLDALQCVGAGGSAARRWAAPSNLRSESLLRLDSAYGVPGSPAAPAAAAAGRLGL